MVNCRASTVLRTPIFPARQSAEEIFQFVSPEIEYGCQLSVDKKAVQQVAEKSHWHNIMHQILHFNAAFNLLENMSVVPEPIGAAALFIHKSVWGVHMTDLGYPGDGESPQRRYPIRDDQTVVDHIRGVGGYFKTESRRRDSGQIIRRRKKLPGSVHGNGESLAAMKLMQDQWNSNTRVAGGWPPPPSI